jgi:hypothetical protein
MTRFAIVPISSVDGAASILGDPETEFAVVATPDSGAGDAHHILL